jgi:hypothetical protein
MKYLLCTLAIPALCLFALRTNAQQAKSNSKVTYILPEGGIVDEDKLDSVRRAWGADRVIMRHNDENDHKKIVRLERLTDKMLQDMAANSAAGLEILKRMIGHTATDFTVTDLKGQQVQLSKLQGMVVVVNFWFAACPPCIAEMPTMNQLV